MRYLAFFFLTGSLAAANLFTEDTGFETGVQNFRYYRSEEPIRTVANDAAEGRSSLEIDGSVSWAQGRWCYTIKKDTDYVVSFFARRVSGGDSVDFAFIGVADWRQIGRTAFRLTDEWQRYSCRIRTDRPGAGLFPAFLPKGNTVVHIDAIQLEEGREPTPYQPAEPFSVYSSVAPGDVVHTPEMPKMTVNLFNGGVAAENFTLRVALAGKTRELPFSLKRGEAKSVTVEFPEAAAPGYYPAAIEIRQGETVVKQTAAPFVVTAPFAGEKPGFFGMQESPLPNSYLARIGTSRLRTNISGWKAYEPREGEWKTPALRKPAALYWHPTLNHELIGGTIPAWALRPDGKKADLGKAALFFEHLFRQYQGQAEFIDFLNEPDLTIGRPLPDGAEYYSELLRTAAPIARKYGLKLMVDVSGVRSSFYEKVLKNAGDCFEIAAPHPYASPRIFMADGSYVASPEKGDFASSLKVQAELARKHHKELVIGELGYSLEETVPFDDPLAHQHATYLARMFLIARSYPECRYLIWFLGLDRWEAGPYCYGIWRTENGIRPLPAVAAYAQAAHEIDHADEVKWLLDSDLKILSYRKAGRTSYAVWNAGDEAEPLALALPPDAAPRSIYGTPLQTAAITGTPLYLSENAAGTVLPALRTAIDARPALVIRGYLRDRETLKLQLYNRGFDNWQGEVEIASLGYRGQLTVPRQSSETVTVKFSGAVPSALVISARGGEGKAFESKLTLPPMQKLPRLTVADLEKYDFRPQLAKYGIRQAGREDVYPPDPSIPWSGPEDLSHRTLLGWDDENLYIFSEVKDDLHLNPHPDAASWKGDSLQLGIDSWNDADGKLAYDADDHEFCFALGKKPWCHQAPPTREAPGEAAGIRQFITRDEAAKTTTYRIAIPRRLVSPLKLREGSVFGLSLCFNDEDPGESRYHMNWGGGIGDLKCPARFRKVMLEK